MEYVEYNEKSHGKLIYPDGFKCLLEGLSLEEQMDYFRIGNGVYRSQEVSKRRKSEHFYSCSLQGDKRVEAIIVCDNMIAGVMVRNCYGKLVPCTPERGFVVVDEDELDGSGYINLTLYSYLICVTKDFDNN